MKTVKLYYAKFDEGKVIPTEVDGIIMKDLFAGRKVFVFKIGRGSYSLTDYATGYGIIGWSNIKNIMEQAFLFWHAQPKGQIEKSFKAADKKIKAQKLYPLNK